MKILIFYASFYFIIKNTEYEQLKYIYFVNGNVTMFMVCLISHSFPPQTEPKLQNI